MLRLMKLSALSAWLFLSVAGVTLGSVPQATSVNQLDREAAAAYDSKDWSEAARLYGLIVQKTTNPRAWYRLGMSLNKTGEKDKAIEALEKGRAMGLPPQFVEYGIATVLASKKDKDKAL